MCNPLLNAQHNKTACNIEVGSFFGVGLLAYNWWFINVNLVGVKAKNISCSDVCKRDQI